MNRDDVVEALRAAANVGYLTCAKTRHVSLGDKVRSEILALASLSETQPVLDDNGKITNAPPDTRTDEEIEAARREVEARLIAMTEAQPEEGLVEELAAWLSNWHRKAVKAEYMGDGHYRNAASALLSRFTALSRNHDEALPDEIDLFRIIRRAGRKDADKAKAVHAHLTAALKGDSK